MPGTHAARPEPRPLRVALHADDFGMSRAVNEGILRGFRHGPLTSTSLLANAPCAAEAIREWKLLAEDREAGRLPSASLRGRLGDARQRFDLGVHLNLTQGRPLTGDRYPEQLLDRRGRFPGIAALARLLRGGQRFRDAVEEELRCQVEFLLAHGVQPTHVNGHQYIELVPAVGQVVARLLQRFHIRTVRIPLERSLLRSTLLSGFPPHTWILAGLKRAFAHRFRTLMARLPVACPDGFFGTAHAGRIDLRLVRCFLGACDRFGLVEIALHPAGHGPTQPATAIEDGWADPLEHLRPQELEMLLSDELQRHLERQTLGLGRLGNLAA